MQVVDAFEMLRFGRVLCRLKIEMHSIAMLRSMLMRSFLEASLYPAKANRHRLMLY